MVEEVRVWLSQTLLYIYTYMYVLTNKGMLDFWIYTLKTKYIFDWIITFCIWESREIMISFLATIQIFYAVHINKWPDECGTGIPSDWPGRYPIMFDLQLIYY